MNVAWLASYPRSGNAWLRTLLYSYIYGQAATSNDIGAAIPDIERKFCERFGCLLDALGYARTSGPASRAVP